MVALLSEKADIQYYPEDMDPEQLVKEVESLGFGASLIPDQDSLQEGKIDLTVRLGRKGEGRSFCGEDLVVLKLP